MPATPQPGFIVHRQYLKDLSFENPTGPVPAEEADAIETSIDGHIASHALQPERWFEVDITLTIVAQFKERTVFLVELTYIADVELKLIPEPVQAQILAVDVANFMLPQINAVIDHAAKAGGFAELRIADVNFRALYNRSIRQPAATATPKPGPARTGLSGSDAGQ